MSLFSQVPLFDENVDENIDLNLFFRSSRDLFCIAGFDGYFKKINPAVVETLGYTEEELFSQPINSFVHPDDQFRTEIGRQGLRESKHLMHFENRYLTKEGRIIWLSWTSVPDSNRKLIFAVAKNITHLKIQENDRNQEIKHMNEQYQEFKEMLYTTIHDLRSPVGNLVSILDIYEEMIEPVENNRECVDLLKASVKNLQDVLEAHLDRLVNENKSASTVGCSFEDALAKVVTGLLAVIKDTDTSIQADFSGASWVTFDDTCLSSIFLNLITNSIKYARQNVSPVIHIYTIDEPDQIKLIYTDNGRGFDMDQVGKQLFQIGQRFHFDADGKGVGLYLIKKHLSRWGGTIRLESIPGEGSIFTISFRK